MLRGDGRGALAGDPGLAVWAGLAALGQFGCQGAACTFQTACGPLSWGESRRALRTPLLSLFHGPSPPRLPSPLMPPPFSAP